MWSFRLLAVSLYIKMVPFGMISRWVGLLFTIVTLPLLPGCRTSSDEIAGPPQTTTTVRLAAGDVIKVSFAGAPELTQLQKIRTDGRVNLPMIGEVSAAGKTLTDLQKELIRLYKSQLKNNDVLVTLEGGTGSVTVSGAVLTPHRIEFDRPTTVFQAIMQAGGPTPYGTLKKVRLVRVVNGQEQSQVMDLTGTLKGLGSQVVYVKDGDVIIVPESLF
jgi:protein involved in polysaccharide export with SLBB domain